MTVETLWERIYRPSTRELSLTRHGPFWEAVSVARRSSTGADKVVAVIDSGFDVDALDLHPLHRASRTDESAVGLSKHHGTTVAGLIREVAPDASLLLIEVGAEMTRRSVSQAILHARDNGADVINVSMEWSTGATPRSMEALEALRPDDPEPDPQEFVRAVQAWIDAAEPYGRDGCRRPCAICDAVRLLPDDPVVIAAAGNGTTAACPACLRDAVAVGFRRFEQREVAGRRYDVPSSAATPTDRSLIEFEIEEPPGFVGTSYAAPLMSGFAALLPDPTELRRMARFRTALAPIVQLQFLHSSLPDGTVSRRAHEVLGAGVAHFQSRIPERYRYWERPSATELSPCPISALVLVDLYKAEVSRLIASGDHTRAVALGRVGAAVAPGVAAVHGNLGRALILAAWAERDRRIAIEAVAEMRRAAELAPDSEIYRHWLGKAVELAEA